MRQILITALTRQQGPGRRSHHVYGRQNARMKTADGVKGKGAAMGVLIRLSQVLFLGGLDSGLSSVVFTHWLLFF